MPFRLPKILLPKFPPTGDYELDHAFEEWRQQTEDLLSRDFQEIENFAYGSGFRALRLTSATITTANPAAIALDTEQWDTDNMHDPLVNPSRGTANNAGVYVVAGHIPFKVVAGGSYRQTGLWINGNASVVDKTAVPRTAGLYQTVSVATVTFLEAQEYLELVASHDAPGSVGVGGSTAIFPTLAMAHLFDIPTLG